MRVINLIGMVVLTSLMLTGCTPNYDPPQYEVLESTYVHKYGVPVTPDDWEARGQDGQVISTLSNGVTVNNNYSRGILDGETTKTYPHSSVVEVRQHYSKNKMNKEMTYYRSGKPKQEITHQPEGGKRIVIWYEDGSPLSIEEIDAQNLLVKAEYRNKDHQLEAWVDSKEGMRVERDTYGQLIARDTIKDGQMTCRTLYHANGSPKSITPYVNGQIEGQCKTFLPEGEPESIAGWMAGKQQGLTIQFSNGEKMAEIYYEHGLKNGVEHRFRDGSMIVEEIMWRDDYRHGPSSLYIGDTVKTDWYFHGKPTTKANFEILMRSPSEAH